MSTTTGSAKSKSVDIETGYLKAKDAAALDEELMSSPGFSLEQLMELAGLSVAEAVYQVVPPSPSTTNNSKPKVLLVCGPGNNGGDGLVAARHLVFFGYDCTVVYPKRSKKEHFVNLVQQCEDVDIRVVDEMPKDTKDYSAIVDSIFGFSFHGEPREPFATALKQMMEAQKAGVPVISVDVPSGWNVDEGDVTNTGFVPEVLVSLTTPKESSRGFPGRHFVGGRFLPPKLAKKYSLNMPPYPGVSQVMEISSCSKATGESVTFSFVANDWKDENPTECTDGWEADYAAYLNEKAAKMSLRAADNSTIPSPSQKTKPAESSWEQQYHDYCIEKEASLAKQDEEVRQAMKKQQQQ